MTKAEEIARKHNGHDKLSDRACPDQPHGAGICMDCRILAAALEKFGAEERKRCAKIAADYGHSVPAARMFADRIAARIREGG